MYIILGSGTLHRALHCAKSECTCVILQKVKKKPDQVLWSLPPLISFASLRCTNPHLASFPVLVYTCTCIHSVLHTLVFIQFKQTSPDTYDRNTFPLFANRCDQQQKYLQQMWPIVEKEQEASFRPSYRGELKAAVHARPLVNIFYFQFNFQHKQGRFLLARYHQFCH